jgi:hypothetical protein
MMMTHRSLLAAFTATLASGIALVSPAQAGGMVRALDDGVYQCALPGDAARSASVRTPSADFTVRNATQYETANGSGTYLASGTRVRFTSGPMKGTRMRIEGSRSLRKMNADGSPGKMICVRAR